MYIFKLSVYALKSRFQLLLKPFLAVFISRNISPNQITLFTCLFCLIYAACLAWSPFTSLLLFCLPIFMFIRMAFNALDGMLAAATNTKTSLGSVLNEICDVISDMALFSAFLVILSTGSSVNQMLWWLLIMLMLLSEFISLAVFQACTIRSHSGPFGKSDRAVYLSIISIIIWAFPNQLDGTSYWLLAFIIFGIALSGITCWNRFKTMNDLNK